MTQTAPEQGFAAAVLAKTKAVILEHYSKALTVVLAAAFGWGSVYATAWIGALPAPPPPPPMVAPSVVVRDEAGTIAKLDAIEAALGALRGEMKARQAPTKKSAVK